MAEIESVLVDVRDPRAVWRCLREKHATLLSTANVPFQLL